jgi:predicted nucleic acid-binding protein
LPAPFVVETNIVSELTRQKPDSGVIAFLNDNSDLYLSVIVLHELEYGVQLAKDIERRTKLENFVGELRLRFIGRIVDVDAQIAKTAGRFRALEKSRGRILAELDAFIAATALVKGATLATRNTKDFDQLGVELLNPFAG